MRTWYGFRVEMAAGTTDVRPRSGSQKHVKLVARQTSGSTVVNQMR